VLCRVGRRGERAFVSAMLLLGWCVHRLTTVSGTVTVQESLDMDSPAAGATVSVHQTSLSTTADEFGEFSFDAFPGALVL